jgi:hypothetical protein
MSIYDHARGDGWILSTSAPLDEWEEIHNGHRVPVALYYTAEQRVEMHDVRNTSHSPLDTFYDQYLDIGAELGTYEGTRVEAGVDYADQPRAVRMQRHAPDIYEAAKHARGMSETIALRAAEEFGSTWREKGSEEWQDRVQMVGEGRAHRIANAIKRE